MTFKSMLYRDLRASNDLNAVRRGKVPQRVGRRVVGRATGRLMGRLFR